MKNNTLIKIISILQIYGGAVGFASVSMLLPNVVLGFTGGYGLGTIITFLLSIILMIGFFILSFVSGLLLYTNKKFGVILSIIVQGLQIFNFIILGYKFVFVSGMSLFFRYLSETISNNSYSFFFFGADAAMNIGGTEEGFMITINFLAMFFFVYLFIYLKKFSDLSTDE